MSQLVNTNRREKTFFTCVAICMTDTHTHPHTPGYVDIDTAICTRWQNNFHLLLIMIISNES